MDVSPKTLREVEFREKMRGYHPDDVDQFLEDVAQGLELLQERLRQAVDRAQRAEAAASAAASAPAPAASAAEMGATDETLRRTLVLAQRTADLAVQEARDQAARIVAAAEQQSQAMLAEAEEHARRAHEDTLAESRAELSRLEGVRQQAQSEIDMLRRWVDEHRARFISSMRESLGHLERTSTSSPAPASRPIDTGVPRRTSITGAGSPPPPGLGSESTPSFGGPPPQVAVEAHPAGPETVVLADPVEAGSEPARGGPNGGHNGAPGAPGSAEARFAVPAGEPTAAHPPPTAADATGPVATVPANPPGPVDEEHKPTGPNPAYVDEASQEEEAALDTFFDDPRYNHEERRFGGRLRRRR